MQTTSRSANTITRRPAAWLVKRACNSRRRAQERLKREIYSRVYRGQTGPRSAVSSSSAIEKLVFIAPLRTGLNHRAQQPQLCCIILCRTRSSLRWPCTTFPAPFTLLLSLSLLPCLSPSRRPHVRACMCTASLLLARVLSRLLSLPLLSKSDQVLPASTSCIV